MIQSNGRKLLLFGEEDDENIQEIFGALSVLLDID